MSEKREIKFRMWGVCEDSPYDAETDSYIPVMVEADDLSFEEFAPLCELLRNTDTQKFMQYTGLKDTRGKDIYEGDIVTDQEVYGSVFWEEAAARFAVRWHGVNSQRNPPVSLQSQAKDVYVVGNIYENANLLPEAGVVYD